MEKTLQTGDILGINDFGSFIKEDGLIIGNVRHARVVCEILSPVRFKVVAITESFDKNGEPIDYSYGET